MVEGKEIGTIRFVDWGEREAAVLLVRVFAGKVIIALFVGEDDLEVIMEPSDCEQVLTALEQGLRIAQGVQEI